MSNTSSTPAADSAPTRRQKCFIVEDSPLILQELTDTLEQVAELTVVGHAADELSAIGWLDTHREGCDLVILDMLLKNGTGLGVLEHLQRLGGAPGLRKVVLTNYAAPAIRQRCTELGADRVFDKSSELESLIEYCVKLSSD